MLRRRSSGARGWGHVRDLSTGRELLARAGKPVINDEPIGAGQRYQPGRRDGSPERFRAAALMSRMIGLGATFRYEGGLQADAAGSTNWSASTLAGGVADVPAGFRSAVLPGQGKRARRVRAGGDGRAVRRCVHSLSRDARARAWLLVFGTEGRVMAEWTSGWTPGRSVTGWDQSMWSPAVASSGNGREDDRGRKKREDRGHPPQRSEALSICRPADSGADLTTPRCSR